MTIIQTNLDMTKGLYANWLQEQDTSILYAYDADKYLMQLLCTQLKFMTNESDEEIGRYVKEYMQFVDDELDKIRKQ